MLTRKKQTEGLFGEKSEFASCITCMHIDNCEILDALDASGGVNIRTFSCSEYQENEKLKITRPDLQR